MDDYNPFDEKYDGVLVPISKETTDIERVLQENSKQPNIEEPKAPKVTDLEAAKLAVLECLRELAEIQDFFENKTDQEVNLASQVLLTKLSRDETSCKNREIQHLHATLNGIPVVLKLKQVEFIITCVHYYIELFNYRKR